MRKWLLWTLHRQPFLYRMLPLLHPLPETVGEEMADREFTLYLLSIPQRLLLLKHSPCLQAALWQITTSRRSMMITVQTECPERCFSVILSRQLLPFLTNGTPKQFL